MTRSRETMIAELGRRHPAAADDVDAILAMPGEWEVKHLDWQETFVDRGDGARDSAGWEADSGFGPWYIIEMYFGSDAYGWTIEYDAEKIGDVDDPEKAKEIAQADFDRRAIAALSRKARP